MLESQGFLAEELNILLLQYNCFSRQMFLSASYEKRSMQQKRGLFIVFEGIDGSGKTSQIELLAHYIRENDKYQDILLTREPTWRASALREKLQGDNDAFSDGERMARLFVQDRNVHTRRQIISELEEQSFVLCDRYAMSTCAYQLTQGVPLDTLLRYHEEAQTLTPDLTLYLDVPREVAGERMAKRGKQREKFERDTAFTDLLIANYRSLARRSADDAQVQRVLGPVAHIDGTPSIDNVAAAIKEAYGRAYIRHYSSSAGL